ncbi:MAG: hypothetical protein K9M80_08585 [Candidatus Marinimicrobia bacterium]|nr:hypothetical protein [Candidatus Neomarinimicrobiota bacterium]
MIRFTEEIYDLEYNHSKNCYTFENNRIKNIGQSSNRKQTQKKCAMKNKDPKQRKGSRIDIYVF